MYSSCGLLCCNGMYLTTIVYCRLRNKQYHKVILVLVVNFEIILVNISSSPSSLQQF